ncbi:MAG: YitT family protein [Oscillospiraceae bacterium]|nr:YitT family protein [Oscillospiraceae bacterium]MBQ7130743.1 YitT family protein [Oscillospiraceae bacterium]
MLPKLKPTNCLVAFLASAFQAFGIYNIHAVADVTEGGVLGATLLLQYWLGISPALSSFILNALCFALGWKVLGKSFIAYSFLAAAGYSLGYRVCELFPPLWPEIVAWPQVAAVVGALFIGIGAGLTVRSGGATTGDDALAMSISHITKIPIQYIYLVSDLSILLLSLTYIPFRRISWSLLTVTLSGQIIGWIQPKERK